ncbi:MAG: hypothetical protein NUW02_02725 [Candidatus Campbellbacteria bacterium]|nr:hypothetical protein [Candidatus Campbellbacteria bacterium]
MKNLFNHSFFHFMFGFVMVLLFSFVVLFVVNYFMQLFPRYAETDIPFSTCITNTGEEC